MPKDEGIEYITLLRQSARDVKKTSKKKTSKEQAGLDAAMKDLLAQFPQPTGQS